MKTGDLVTLSEYGLKRDYNLRISKENPKAVGLIIKFDLNYSYPYTVLWSSDPRRAERCPRHSRRELKYAR